mgnify:CR=1 FL=1
MNDYYKWWNNEGSGMRPLKGNCHEAHARRMTEIAWSNGEYKAKERIEMLEAKLKTLEAGLKSIANNTCCGSCQEARKVAEKTLKEAQDDE